MCVSAQLKLEFSALERLWNRRMWDEIRSRLPIYYGSAFDDPTWPVVTAEEPDLVMAKQWRFVPFWAKDAKVFKSKFATYNARTEGILKSATYGHAFREGRRCLVPVTAFFEHHTVGKLKVPYAIALKDRECFSIAGIYEGMTFTMLTCTANPLMAQVHNITDRMVVILPRELEEKWLDSSLTPEEALAMCVPYPQEEMKAWTISKRITQRGIEKNVQGIDAPFEYLGVPAFL